ncbi:MAG: hydrogenase maturation nickel metallochaperone HypA [Deltaproteobacteria bacterium]|nr:hydrogenase maturation nickel metallochaperone HypA [Deltaproteobacteria bacterium]
MHELSLARSIVDTVVSRLSGMDSHITVKKIALRVGPLDAVVPDSLQYCFDMCADDTPLEGAELKVTVDTIDGRCRDCGSVFEVEQPVFLCPRCHGPNIELEQLQAPVIEAIDFDDWPGDASDEGL